MVELALEAFERQVFGLELRMRGRRQREGGGEGKGNWAQGAIPGGQIKLSASWNPTP